MLLWHYSAVRLFIECVITSGWYLVDVDKCICALISRLLCRGELLIIILITQCAVGAQNLCKLLELHCVFFTIYFQIYSVMRRFEGANKIFTNIALHVCELNVIFFLFIAEASFQLVYLWCNAIHNLLYLLCGIILLHFICSEIFS